MINVDVLREGRFYHVYNRTNANEILFKDDQDYKRFLNNLRKHLGHVINIYAYCLMKTHFHLLIEVKTNKYVEDFKIKYFTNKYKCKTILEEKFFVKTFDFPDNSTFLSQLFSNLFNSYSKVFNKIYQRHGNLFERPFHRRRVRDVEYLKYLFFYIHENPMRNTEITNFKEVPWTSFNEILELDSSRVSALKVISIFGSINEFKNYHVDMLNYARSKNDWLEIRHS